MRWNTCDLVVLCLWLVYLVSIMALLLLCVPVILPQNFKVDRIPLLAVYGHSNNKSLICLQCPTKGCHSLQGINKGVCLHILREEEAYYIL